VKINELTKEIENIRKEFDSYKAENIAIIDEKEEQTAKKTQDL